MAASWRCRLLSTPPSPHLVPRARLTEEGAPIRCSYSAYDGSKVATNASLALRSLWGGGEWGGGGEQAGGGMDCRCWGRIEGGVNHCTHQGRMPNSLTRLPVMIDLKQGGGTAHCEHTAQLTAMLSLQPARGIVPSLLTLRFPERVDDQQLLDGGVGRQRLQDGQLLGGRPDDRHNSLVRRADLRGAETGQKFKPEHEPITAMISAA
jgi:hypothetical protein